MHPDIESSGTGVFDRGCPVFLDQGMHSQDAADAGLALLLIDQLAELADLGSRMFGATQQLRGAERHFLRVIFFLDAISASFLAQVLAKKFVSVWIQDRTCSSSHCMSTERPIHPIGGTA